MTLCSQYIPMHDFLYQCPQLAVCRPCRQESKWPLQESSRLKTNAQWLESTQSGRTLLLYLDADQEAPDASLIQ